MPPRTRKPSTTKKAAPKLRSVPTGDAAPAQPEPPKPPPTKVAEAAEHSERALLVALRAKAAKDIDAGVPAHALSALIRQIRELDRDIRALDLRAKEEADDGDDVEDGDFDAASV